MHRRCTICDSDRLDDIDRMLVESRTSFRRIASLCDVSEASVRRHAAAHLPDALAAAMDAERIDSEMLDELVSQHPGADVGETEANAAIAVRAGPLQPPPAQGLNA